MYEELNFPDPSYVGEEFRQNGTVYVWDGEHWNPRTRMGTVTTRDVLTVPATTGDLEEARQLVEPWIDPPGDLLETQEDVNNTIAGVSAKAIRQQYRINDNVDFLQNSVATGFWVGLVPNQQGQLPEAGYFAGFKGNVPTTNFAEADRFVFAGEGVNPSLGSANPQLAETKAGDNLLIQQHDDNHFGIYVVDNVEIIGEPNQGGSWWVWMNVRVASNRAVGDFEDGSHCTVKTSRPVFTLAAEEPPVLSESGQLWYDKKNKALKVWDADVEEFVSTGGDGGGDVDLSDYLPLTGGTLTGDLNVQAPLTVEGSELKVQYGDDTTMLRVQPNADNISLNASTINTRNTSGSLGGRAGVEIQVHGDKPLAISHSGSYQPTLEIYGYDGEAPGGRARNLWIGAQGNVNTEGNVNAQSFVKGSELRSTKLTSGQSSNLAIYRGSGQNEERKMLIGSDSVNFDVDIKLTSSSKKDIQVQNGTQLYVTPGEQIITFGGSGAFYRGVISQPDHIANKAYADALVEDGPFLPLTGGDLSGQLNIDANSGVALSINSNKVKFWSSGAVELNGYTSFKDNELVTKSYVDNAIEAGGGGGYVVPQWRWTNNLWDNASDGEWGMLDKDNASTSRFDTCRGIWWKGVDKDGNRPFNDADWQDISQYFPGPLYIQKDGKSIFRVAQATGIAGLCLFEYVRSQNLYYVGWSDATLGAAIAGYTGVTNGGTYGLLVPELIYA